MRGILGAVVNVVLVLLVILLIGTQVYLVPALAAATSEAFPDYRPLASPGTIAADTVLFCFELALVGIALFRLRRRWPLVVKTSALLTIGACGVGAALAVASFIVLKVQQILPPSVAGALAAACLIFAALAVGTGNAWSRARTS